MVVTRGAVPWISIIIPCKGHGRELRVCLQGLQRQQTDLPFEIIVVDAAYDSEVALTASQFAAVRLLRSHADLSTGAARNYGAANAHADVLGFIDADCIPAPGWISAAGRAIADGAALAGGPVIDALPWNWIASTDNRLQFVDFPPGRPAGVNPYLPGVQHVMPRQTFADLGGYDTSHNVAQDVLFSEAATRRWPGKTRFYPDLIVAHLGRTTFKAFWDHQWQFGFTRVQYNLRMGAALSRLARHASLASIVLLRRWLYISARLVQWNLRDLPRYLWQTPLLLIGLVAWTRGFYAARSAEAVGPR